MSKDKIILFDDKKNCCACGACMNVCPKDAIRMEEDEYGFLYPQIDETKCVQCGACKKVCAYQNGPKLFEPKQVFVAVSKNKNQLLNSASGGVFAAVATKILKDGGVVFGATLDFENGHANPHHIKIENQKQLTKLQGSKYVQSSIGITYKQTKDYLKKGRIVLFSGTPCQISGLYEYLGKEYNNLYTIDVICHGVPNAKFFDDYLQIEKQRRSADKIEDYAFRDKRKGWGMNGRITLAKGRKQKKVYIPARLNSYNTLFLDGMIYRENCYSCKYARRERCADLTIGDYWGIEKEHPELLKNNMYNEKEGISCILANTEKGIKTCQNIKELLQMNDSSFEKVSRRNGQLNIPSKRPDSREMIMRKYSDHGYIAIEKWFRKKYKKQIIVHRIYNMIPRTIRLKLKVVIKGK